MIYKILNKLIFFFLILVIFIIFYFIYYFTYFNLLMCILVKCWLCTINSLKYLIRFIRIEYYFFVQIYKIWLKNVMLIWQSNYKYLYKIVSLLFIFNVLSVYNRCLEGNYILLLQSTIIISFYSKIFLKNFLKKIYIKYKKKKFHYKQKNVLTQNINNILLIVIFYLIISNVKIYILDLMFYINKFKLIENFILIIFIILIAAYISLLERQVVGILQQRFGPSLTGGFWSLIQPIADGFKLLIKEIIIPSKSKIFLFLLAPIYTFVLTLSIWTLIPFSSNSSLLIWNKEYNILIILVLLIIVSYGPVIGGWASNNKYALFGSYRSIALSGSYGITIGLLLSFPVLYSQSFNLNNIVYGQENCWYILPIFEASVFFWIILLTEIKKVPFDVSESEAELSSGYLIEYSGFNFALFIIAEYVSILLLVTLFILLFFGGWLPFEKSIWCVNLVFKMVFNSWIFFFSNILDFINFSLKILLILIFYLTIRTVLPNYRFDYIMVIHWKYLFPFILSLLILNILYV